MYKAFMAFATIYALLGIAQLVASPTIPHAISAAAYVALALFFDLIIWTTYHRKRD
jgi:hypothetical protein